MHDHSLKAHIEEYEVLDGRKRDVWDYLTKHGPSTDREVMINMGFLDMNAVRPRITELINESWCVEKGSIQCSVTKKKVRLTAALTALQRDQKIRESLPELEQIRLFA